VSVVLLTIIPNDHPGFGQRMELLPVQAFVPEAAVEAL